MSTVNFKLKSALQFECRLQLKVHGVVGLAEMLAAFGVPDDDMGHAHGNQHGSVDLSGESTFIFPVKILRANGDVGAFGGMQGGIDAKERGAHDNFVAVVAGNQRKKVRKKSRVW